MTPDQEYEYEVIVQARMYVRVLASHPALAETSAIRTGLEISKTIEEAYPHAAVLPYKIVPMTPYGMRVLS
jgi:hypothetical protein